MNFESFVKKTRAVARLKTEGRRDKAREQRLKEWGQHHTKPVEAAAVAGVVEVAVGTADVVLIAAERAAAQHPQSFGF